MPRMYRRMLVPLIALAACAGICCQRAGNEPSATDDRPAARRPAEPGTTTPESRPASQPAGGENAAADAPTDAASSAAPGQADPGVPSYIRILESTDPQRRTEVRAELPETGIINLETSNVRRLRLERGSLPFESGGSIAVRIDGQGIEWQRRYEALELVQLGNGSWEIVRPPVKP